MKIKLSRLVEIRAAVGSGIDPVLQRAQALKTGKEYAVAARVSSVREWDRIPHVLHRSVLGKARSGGFIVTGRIDVERVAAVRLAPCVMSLKASRPLRPQLETTVSSMRLRPDLLPRGAQPRGGAGVVVGIIDAGCDFAHPNFRNEDGSTRLLALWHQDGKTRRGDDVLYGRSFSSAQINRALANTDPARNDPYRALGYHPYREDPKGAHGTHVMDIAAGNGLGTRQAGVAPQADLVFVDVSSSDVVRKGVAAAGGFMGDSVLMLEALDYIFRKAGRRPCVINLSLGSTGGPHDGSSLVEQGIDALVRAKPNRAVVVAAGNFQVDALHAQGTIPPRGAAKLKWTVPDSGGELECWYDGGAELEATLVGPDGTAFRAVPTGSNATFGIRKNAGRKPYIFIANRGSDPNNRENHLNIWLHPGLPTGNWTVRLRSRSRERLAWHAWIERSSDPATFPAADASHTLGSISTGFDSIVVGAYNAHATGFPLSPKSSSGTTRDGRRKPELSAPGHEVHAARAYMTDTLVHRSGTSMAAPAVAGLVALIYAQARRARKSLTIDQLRKKLLNGLDPTPSAGRPGTKRDWHPRYGYGRASAKALKK
jgi:subtilisin family serine protease